MCFSATGKARIVIWPELTAFLKEIAHGLGIIQNPYTCLAGKADDYHTEPTPSSSASSPPTISPGSATPGPSYTG